MHSETFGFVRILDLVCLLFVVVVIAERGEANGPHSETFGFVRILGLFVFWIYSSEYNFFTAIATKLVIQLPENFLRILWNLVRKI